MGGGRDWELEGGRYRQAFGMYRWEGSMAIKRAGAWDLGKQGSEGISSQMS